MICGGTNRYGPLASAETFDPASGRFLATNPMSEARNANTATLLNDGRVLVAGGSVTGEIDGSGVTSSAELYDPATRSFTALSATLDQPRFRAAAVPLKDGTVLIVDGVNGATVLADAQIYLPATKTFVAPFRPTVRAASLSQRHAAQ